ncbi:hypothetical protein DBV15_01178 [Temnothorax longispinosus]|uniref:Ig-like domain-containing protein n=1 Tax=Temnothorax longispinosus TaxID=300112 RepID=A0A4S2JDG1_9HYME|nr:hypothetical protein DBV15_01178 [Temnothorax longispinosus]
MAKLVGEWGRVSPTGRCTDEPQLRLIEFLHLNIRNRDKTYAATYVISFIVEYHESPLWRRTVFACSLFRKCDTARISNAFRVAKCRRIIPSLALMLESTYDSSTIGIVNAGETARSSGVNCAKRRTHTGKKGGVAGAFDGLAARASPANLFRLNGKCVYEREAVKLGDGEADRFLHIERLSCGRFPHRVTGLSDLVRARVDETQMDTHEGSTVQLQCRFPPPRENVTCFWLTHTNNNLDNAAIENRSLSPNYKVFMNLQEGRYDLQIRNVSYERDNGKYECRVKVSSTGTDLHRKYITLTVLRAPGPPTISPASTAATEGQRLELQCNTYGGSPEPEVKWYRGNNTTLLHTGRTLEIMPTREDDRAIFRCVVRNRAMREGETLDASVTLDVNYFPRVSVGPENPLKVEVNGTATLKCHVDSKPRVGMVRWWRDGSFIATNFEHVIPKVTLQDVGKYTCHADNGLQPTSGMDKRGGEAYLILDVLYPPTVSIEGDAVRVADVEDSVTVHCNVSANPLPTVIEWLRDGRPEFRQGGSILRLTRVTAEHAGNYTCRAVNTIHPTGGERRNHSAFASVTIRVRHKPGPARVTPDSPVAVEGSRVILTCMASPAGYPEPQYKWWKEGESGMIPMPAPSGPKYEIDSVHLGSEGTYKCHAINEIGIGEAASVNLTVHQPPKILTKLQPHVTRKNCTFVETFHQAFFFLAVGPSYIAQAGSLGTPTLIALIVSGAVFLLFAALLLLFCRCRRKHATKAKDYEMDSNAVRPSLVAGNGQQTQPPPPYYAENKALEHSLDHALALEDSKTPAYSQSGYGYHQPNHNINGVNMGYMDNSYSNSNNGGSVNSQDSIWQMKSAAANGVNQPYDLAGYGTTESDYPTHPHYLPQREDYRESHNLSRQQFCTEPFATVVKSQKHVVRLASNDSPYIAGVRAGLQRYRLYRTLHRSSAATPHCFAMPPPPPERPYSPYDVSGLPYQENYDEDTKPPQQASLSYDESLESGYSTPNRRRIIREIIQQAPVCHTVTQQHRPHHLYHRHRHRHRMEIVLENPSVPPIVTAATTTTQMGLPTHPPHHFPHRAAYDVGLGRSPSLLPAEDYYARNRHALTPYGELDGAPAPVTVRRIDKSGLLEIAETDPVTCPRPCVLTGAEDVAARGVSLRIDRSGLLEAVPEAVDQPEEHNGGATTKMLDEAAGISRGETLKVDADVKSRVFEGGCLLERPSSLEGQACPDEVDTRAHSADFKVLSGSPRARLDVSKATERLPHFPFSPGLSLRRLRNDPSRRSPLTSRCVDADLIRGPRSQRSPEFTAKCTAANSADPSQNPVTRERSQVGCTKSNVDPASTDSDIPAVDANKTLRESLLTRDGAEQEDDPPGEERAEAEGCEHTTVESLEEDEVSFKGSNKLLDNDNVQTLRVIILSEQFAMIQAVISVYARVLVNAPRVPEDTVSTKDLPIIVKDDASCAMRRPSSSN